jgi:hypothetical protein
VHQYLLEELSRAMLDDRRQQSVHQALVAEARRARVARVRRPRALLAVASRRRATTNKETFGTVVCPPS